MLQNWSCHNCGGCCRQHAIEVTEEERLRILGQNWTEADGIPAGAPLFAWQAGPPWKKRYRLAHQPDGACRFLDEKGLCRIHAKHGEAAKPLACRVYPYAFHPAGKTFAVSLRFSCPSVVANRGKPLTEQAAGIRRTAELVIPRGAERMPPPRVSRLEQVEWPDFLRFIRRLDETFAATDVPLVERVLRALFWIDLVGKAQFEKVKGARLDELLDLIMQAGEEEIGAALPGIAEPTTLGRTQFRMLAALYARKDTFADVNQGWRGRWKLLRAALRFARGTGQTPRLQEAFQEVPFAALEEPFGPLPHEADEILTRYFRVKIQGIHFCGPAYYEVPLVEGFQSLALMYPVVQYLARWLAVGRGRTSLAVEDVADALAIADHHHGYSPALAQSSARRRVRMLAATGDLSRLCAWYTR